MADIDLKALIDGGGNPAIKDNALSIGQTIKEADVFLAGVERLFTRLERMHVLPVLLRAVGAKYNIDVDRPLGAVSPEVAAVIPEPTPEEKKVISDNEQLKNKEIAKEKGVTTN